MLTQTTNPTISTPVKPVTIPITSLNQLQGKANGKVELPHYHRLAHKNFKHTNPYHVRIIYQTLLNQPTQVFLLRRLNKQKLIKIWGTLNLRPEVREAWEQKFPELTT